MNFIKSYWNAIGTALIALLFLIVLSGVNESAQQLHQKRVPLVLLCNDISVQTALGHLWFEEYIAGDKSMDFQRDILDLFDKANDRLSVAIDRELSETGDFRGIEDLQVNRLKKVSSDIDRLIDLTSLRSLTEQKYRQNNEPVDSSFVSSEGVARKELAGGIYDQEYDTHFNRIQEELEDIVRRETALIRAETMTHNGTVRTLLFFLAFILFSYAGYLFYTTRKQNLLVTAYEVQLSAEISRSRSAAEFIDQIAIGNLEVTPAGNQQEDPLTQKLLLMRNSLKRIAAEDQKRNWSNEGFAQFAEVLRSAQQNQDQFYDLITAFLVGYLKANQAGLFLLQEDKSGSFLELVSFYAFEKKKFAHKQIRPGEGLVGQCFLEKDLIYLTEIPDDYVKVTSGLGLANPKNIVLTPIKINDDVMGVFELACFTPLAKHEVDFLVKAAESIAVTVSTVKSSQKLRKLLGQAQQQSEEMRAQEEEMRQNLEELQATQEEIIRKELAYKRRIEELERKPGNNPG